jgi:deazaflavin-dependent oxidoreductase (nitroreductase family)
MRVERALRAVNRIVEPAVRAGVGNSLAGPGVFLVETTGRRTGLRRPIPLLGVRVGDALLVATVRRHSQWAHNLEQHPVADVWIAGRRQHATANLARPAGRAVAHLTIQPTSSQPTQGAPR